MSRTNATFFDELGDILVERVGVNSYADGNEIDTGAQNFARYLRAARKVAGLSLPEMAEQTNLSEAKLVALERGIIVSTEIEPQDLHRLAEVLNEDIDVFAAILGLSEIPRLGAAGVPARARNTWQSMAAYFDSSKILTLVLGFMLSAIVGSAVLVDKFILLSQSYYAALLPADISMVTSSIQDLLLGQTPGIDYVATLSYLIRVILIIVLILLSFWWARWKGHLILKFTARMWERRLVYVTTTLLCILMLPGIFLPQSVRVAFPLVNQLFSGKQTENGVESEPIWKHNFLWNAGPLSDHSFVLFSGVGKHEQTTGLFYRAGERMPVLVAAGEITAEGKDNSVTVTCDDDDTRSRSVLMTELELEPVGYQSLIICVPENRTILASYDDQNHSAEVQQLAGQAASLQKRDTYSAPLLAVSADGAVWLSGDVARSVETVSYDSQENLSHFDDYYISRETSTEFLLREIDNVIDRQQDGLESALPIANLEPVHLAPSENYEAGHVSTRQGIYVSGASVNIINGKYYFPTFDNNVVIRYRYDHPAGEGPVVIDLLSASGDYNDWVAHPNRHTGLLRDNESLAAGLIEEWDAQPSYDNALSLLLFNVSSDVANYAHDVAKDITAIDSPGQISSYEFDVLSGLSTQIKELDDIIFLRADGLETELKFIETFAHIDDVIRTRLDQIYSSSPDYYDRIDIKSRSGNEISALFEQLPPPQPLKTQTPAMPIQQGWIDEPSYHNLNILLGISQSILLVILFGVILAVIRRGGRIKQAFHTSKSKRP